VYENAFYEMAALLALAAAGGGIALLLRQPLIVAFIAVGILAGPAGLGWVTPAGQLDLLAKLGIAVLLFVVGLKLDIGIIRTMGMVSLATGLGQVIFTSVIGFFLALLLGMSPVVALYVAVALTFSSTIIIVKLLSDKREVDALHGRIALGFLIVQDIVVVIAMIVLTASGAGADGLGREMIWILVKGAGILVAVGLMMRYVLPGVTAVIAHSPELLVLFSIAWAVALAAAGDALGFSKEVGAFLAGISLASTHYREAIGARLVGLRDFLLLFFFIELGAQLNFGLLGAQLGSALVLSAFVLLGNPLIVMIIMGALGYRKRTGFLAGLTVAQISEFSLILAALGLSLGHIPPETVGLITLVGLITISASTYMILYSHPLYRVLEPFLGRFERKRPSREITPGEGDDLGSPDVILLGLGRFGTAIAHELHLGGWRVLAVDFDPAVVTKRRTTAFTAIYGDAEDPELLTALPLSGARWVVCTVRDSALNELVLQGLRHVGYRGRIALTTHVAHEVRRLRGAGADLVFLPYADAARGAAATMLNPSEAEPV